MKFFAVALFPLAAALAVPTFAAETASPTVVSAPPPLGRRMRTDIANAPLAATPLARPAAPAVTLPPLPEGVAELRFEDFFKTPVGPRGLELTDRLKALEGKRVRILGHMVREESETHAPVASASGPAESGVVPDRLLLAPSPQSVNFEHYGLGDELPPQVVFVTTAAKTGRAVPFQPGPLLLTGVLSVGPKPEPEGRVSVVRLALDPSPAAAPAPSLSSVQSNNNPTPSAP